MLLKKAGITSTRHIVISHSETKWHNASQLIDMPFCHGPLSEVIFIDDVSNMTDEDNVLLITIFNNPLHLSLKIQVCDRIAALRRGFAVPASVVLRVGDDHNREGPGRHRRQRLCADHVATGHLSKRRPNKESNQQEKRNRCGSSDGGNSPYQLINAIIVSIF